MNKIPVARAAVVEPNKVRLTDKLAYELHKPVRIHCYKRRVLARSIDVVWTADLIDMQHYAHCNDNFKYILTVIDVFGKYGWMRVLKQNRYRSCWHKE